MTSTDRDDTETFHVKFTYEVELPPDARGELDAARYARNVGKKINTEVEKVDE